MWLDSLDKSSNDEETMFERATQIINVFGRFYYILLSCFLSATNEVLHHKKH